MNKYYKNFMKNKDLVCVYSDTNDSESFSAGYIVGVSEEDIILYHLTPNGKYDGYILLPIENIFLTEFNTKYTKKLESIYKNILNNDIMYFDSETLKLSLLKYAYENDFVCEIQLINSGLNDVVGKIFEFDEMLVKVEKYTEYGENDGEAIFDINNITRLSCDSEESQTLKKII